MYDSISAMEPLLPAQNRHYLAELSQELLIKIGYIRGQVHSPLVRQRIAELIRGMNCYYSNLIEGHKTLPKDILQAQTADHTESPQKRDIQKLADAHIEVEALMRQRLQDPTNDVYSPDFICWLHQAFYERLPESMSYGKTQDGTTYRIEAGQYRNYMVGVGAHTPPHFQSIQGFMERFCQFYGKSNISATNRLIAIAAAHHRLAWIHPFGDGNGRVIRLYSHALLAHHGLDSGGLWTLSRGLSRNRQQYYDTLANADAPRQGDYDGRGNLSDKGLSQFCQFFLKTMLDQIDFMSSRLELGNLRSRVEKFFQINTLQIKENESLPLMKIVRTLIDEGEFPRFRAQEITGKSDSFCRKIIKLGIDKGVIYSPSPKGSLQVTFPHQTLSTYFPGLFDQ